MAGTAEGSSDGIWMRRERLETDYGLGLEGVVELEGRSLINRRRRILAVLG